MSGSSGSPSAFSHTPPLQTMPDPSGTAVAADSSSWAPSFSPTLQPSVLLSSDFTFSTTTPGLSRSFSGGLEDSRYATGISIESFLSEISGDGFPLASDVDTICGCSLEPSVSSSWLHASPHVPLPSSASDSSGLEPYSGVGMDDFDHSVPGGHSDGPSLDRPLPSHGPVSPFLSSSHVLTDRDLPVSVSATAPDVRVSRFSASDVNSHTSPPPISASPFTPTPEGQALDTSSSASGSALSPDSQEGIDQEWDRGQTSASGESVFPYSTKVTNTIPPSTASESGQSPDDSEERSSAFYFESESGSAITSEVGDATTPTTPAVTSASPWSLGGEEESGSGESLYDNETSSDFSISERTERESEEEEPVAGKRFHLQNEKGQGRLILHLSPTPHFITFIFIWEVKVRANISGQQ